MCHRYTKGRRALDAFARLVFPLLCAHKTGKHPKVSSDSSPLAFSALTVPGERLGIRHPPILAKAGHRQPLMPKSLLTCYLTNTPLPLADEPSPELKTDKLSAPSTPRGLVTTKQTSTRPILPKDFQNMEIRFL